MNKVLFFLIRQIYKVVFVWPFQLVVLVLSWFHPAAPLKDREPSSFCFIITSVIYPKQGKIVKPLLFLNKLSGMLKIIK